MREEWKDIEGFSGYSVSNLGRVRGRSGKILSAHEHYGYPQVLLVRIGKRTPVCRRVHVLVLEAFVCPRPEGAVAHHKNGKRNDPRLNNLEWVASHKEHMQKHRILNKEKQKEIKQLYSSGDITMEKLGKQYGVSASAIHSIVHKKEADECS